MKDTEKIKQHAPYDAICCFETLEHLKHPKNVLKLFHECLIDGGHLFLSIPDGDYEPKDIDGEVISEFHLHSFSSTKMVSMLEKSHFKIEQILHQHMGARLHKNFNTTIRDRGISKEELTNLFASDEGSLDILSEVFAWPDETKGQSYSTVYDCIK